VYKAYTSRVGAGPAPTELNDAVGQQIRDLGHEYGATTGRPRRCGWFDGVAARYVQQINALTGVVVTRLDVLDTLPSLKVCVAYRLDGKRIEHLPSNAEDLDRCEPIYEEMPGWQSPTSDIRRFVDLPANAQAYVNRLEALIGSPVVMVSVGPERDQMVFVPEKAVACGFDGDLWKGWLI
jgi:adenylosuccinate synthase